MTAADSVSSWDFHSSVPSSVPSTPGTLSSDPFAHFNMSRASSIAIRDGKPPPNGIPPALWRRESSASSSFHGRGVSFDLATDGSDGAGTAPLSTRASFALGKPAIEEKAEDDK